MPSRHHEAFHLNRLQWDERVPAHLKSAMYQEHIEHLRAGDHCLEQHTLDALEHLTPFVGKSLIHLQCHMGMETLSFAQLGASVTGLDFSRPAIDVANQLAQELDLSANFICANVYDTLEHTDQTFDVVFVSIGALCWLPDLDHWGVIVAKLLKPGGALYLYESHPFGDVLDDHPTTPHLVAAYPYFHPEPLEFDEDGTYADRDAHFQHNKSIAWIHPLGKVVNAVIDAGLTLRRLDESPHCVWPRYNTMTEITPNRFQLPQPLTDTLPMTYTLIASKPGTTQAGR